ncbi:MAG: hypothetical protein IJ764_01575 [Bacteroidales bacterium]|nr:hypothetical protein [Bacteroidales bacterium]
MRISKKLCRAAVAALLCVFCPANIQAQETIKQDTISCFIVGFNVGTIFPSEKGSNVSLNKGGGSSNATMYSLYDSPWLNFGLDGFYKWKTNWLISLEGDAWFGTDNLKHRTERMSNIYTSEGIIIGTNGTDAVVTAYNRGLSVKAGIGKIIPIMPTRNPNSGILAKISAGILQQQTIFTLNEVNAPQIDDDYALLYDHQRFGYTLTEGVGFWFMSNRLNLVNCYVAFELTECWSHSTRDYLIDNYLGINGKDDNSYFDLLYTIKLCWMFPLKGKTAREYYYY